jgi:hypothetical protein
VSQAANEIHLALVEVIDPGTKWKASVRSRLPDPIRFKRWFLGFDQVEDHTDTELSAEDAEDHLLAAAIAAAGALALFIILMLVAAIMFVASLLA